MYPLLLCSVVSFGVTIERAWVLWRASRDARFLRKQVPELLAAGGMAEAAALCRTSGTALAAILRRALGSAGSEASTAERIAKRQLGEHAQQLRAHIWLVGTIGSLAPFVGLFGTVLGIIRSFEDMAAAGSGGFAVVAAGIAEALIATAGGLLVGVLSILAYNALNVRAASTSAAMRDAADEVLQLVAELPPREVRGARVAQSTS